MFNNLHDQRWANEIARQQMIADRVAAAKRLVRARLPWWRRVLSWLR